MRATSLAVVSLIAAALLAACHDERSTGASAEPSPTAVRRPAPAVSPTEPSSKPVATAPGGTSVKPPSEEEKEEEREQESPPEKEEEREK